jgi:PAS domain S-box-containing protein
LLVKMKKSNYSLPIESDNKADVISNSEAPGNDHSSSETEIVNRFNAMTLREEELTLQNNKLTEANKHYLKALADRDDALSKLTQFSIELAMLSEKDNIKALITRRIKEIAGARAAVYSEYDHISSTTSVSHIELEPGPLKQVLKMLGNHLNKIKPTVTPEMYNEMVNDTIGFRGTLYEAALGAIPESIASAVQRFLNVDRFIGVAFIMENKLYGTSLMAMGKGQPDPPIEVLKNFISIASVSLRRRKAEEEIFLLKSIVELSEEAIAVSEESGRVFYINPAHEKLFGYSLDNACKMNYRDFYPVESVKIIEKECIPNLEQNKSWEGELDACDSTGRKFPLWERAGVIPDENGRYKFSFVFMHDVSARKQAEEELKMKIAELAKVNRELEQFTFANQELKQFAYTASHQLQEPIRTVSNFMKVIEEDYSGDLDKNALGYIRIVKDATKRMAILINTLLEFSRIGRDKKLVLSNCNSVINNVIANLDYIIKSSGASVKAGKMPVINLYETEFSLLLQNLIINAIKFQKKGNKPKIKILSEKINDKWRFAIIDNGIGIDHIHFERIFDIFQRLHVSEEEYEGQGIGLAYCKKIVQMHHGEIWFESEPGKGTTFFFTVADLSE